MFLLPVLVPGPLRLTLWGRLDHGAGVFAAAEETS